MIMNIINDLRNQFKDIQKINQGAFGHIFKARRLKDNLQVAIKVINLKELPQFVEKYQREEIRLLELNQNNPFLVKLYDSFEKNQKLYIILEYLDLSLSDLINFQRNIQLSEKNILHFLNQITHGLEILHSQNIIHRDLKPDNIMIHIQDEDLQGLKQGSLNINDIFSRLNFKLIDLGVSKQLQNQNQLTATHAGSASFMAPEIVARLDYGFPADIFSLGVITYWLLYNITPFQNDAFTSNQNIDLKFQEATSLNMQRIIIQMLRQRPKDRISLLELRQAININRRLTGKIKFVNQQNLISTINEHPQELTHATKIIQVEQSSVEIQEKEQTLNSEWSSQQKQGVEQTLIIDIQENNKVNQNIKETQEKVKYEIQVKEQTLNSEWSSQQNIKETQEEVKYEIQVNQQTLNSEWSSQQNIKETQEEVKQEINKQIQNLLQNEDENGQSSNNLYSLQIEKCHSLQRFFLEYQELFQSESERVNYKQVVPQINFLRKVLKQFYDEAVQNKNHSQQKFNQDLKGIKQYCDQIQDTPISLKKQNSQIKQFSSAIIRWFKPKNESSQIEQQTKQIINEVNYKENIQTCFQILNGFIQDLQDYQITEEICQVYITMIELVKCFNLLEADSLEKIKFPEIDDQTRKNQYKLLEFLIDIQEKQKIQIPENL